MPSIPGFIAILIAILLVLISSFHFLPRELEAQGHGQMPRKFGIKGLFAAGHAILLLLLIFAVHFGINYRIIGMILSGEADVAELSEVFDTRNDGSAAGDASATSGANADDGAGNADPLAGGRDSAETPDTVFRPITVQTVVTGTALFFGLFGFGRWRQIEAGILRQLQNVSMIEEDVRLLAKSLGEAPCRLPEQQSEAAAALQRLQKRVAPEAAEDSGTSLAIQWQKVEILISTWEEDDQWGATLPARQTPSLAAARAAHDRKSRLAVRVEAHVQQVERGEADPEVLLEISEQVRGRVDAGTSTNSRTHHDDQATESSADRTSETLNELLGPLVDYFVDEYEEMLSTWANATARSVMLAGDGAEIRLKQLTEKGFSEIGEFTPIELNRAMLIALWVFLGTLLVFYLIPRLMATFIDGVPSPAGGYLFVIAFSITLATILGAMVGGIRSLARRPVPPWGTYIAAGLVIGCTHSILSFTAVSMGVEPIGGGANGGRPLGFFIIVGLIPFSLVLGICYLARTNASSEGLGQILRDALWMAVIVGCAGAIVVIMSDAVGIQPPTEGLGVPTRITIVGSIAAGLGAVIGALVVHHVRKAALSGVVRSSPT